MYNRTIEAYSQRKEARFSSVQSGRGTKGGTIYRQDRMRLVQLLICLALFLTVFIGKGVFPTKLVQVRNNILTMISSDTDFQAAFSRLGESLSGDGSLWGKLGGFCAEVFGPEDAEPPGLSSDSTPQLTSLLRSESEFLSKNPDQKALEEHYFVKASEAVLQLPLDQETQEDLESEPEETPSAVAAVGTVLLKSDYDGQPLPENYTMDQLSLGDLETVTPVLGHINSEYGYRDHPINGNYQFHGGVDIGGQTGDPIQAFAAGTVEYVGEDDSYGLYLQIDHGNGIKSFYAHCNTICVTKGQTVALGEKIAEVGSSGAATGPHLHLELKCNDTHLNPIYYIEYLTDQ